MISLSDFKDCQGNQNHVPCVSSLYFSLPLSLTEGSVSPGIPGSNVNVAPLSELTTIGPLFKVTKRREPSPEIAAPDSGGWDVVGRPVAVTGLVAQLPPELVEMWTEAPRKRGAARKLPSEDDATVCTEARENTVSEGAKEAPPSVEV